MIERLGGAKVEYGSPGGLPTTAMIEEDRGGVPQIAHRLDSFHVSSLDGFEANGDGDQCGELTGLAGAGKGDFRVPVAGHPTEAARLAGGGGGAQKLVGQLRMSRVELFARCADVSALPYH